MRRPPRSPLFPYTTLFRSQLTFRARLPRWMYREMVPQWMYRGMVWQLTFRERLPRSRSREMVRSEEHTSELQSQFHLVCRLLLEKKKLFTNGVDKMGAPLE